MLAGWRRRARKPAGIRFSGTWSSKERPCGYEVFRVGRVSHLGPAPRRGLGAPAGRSSRGAWGSAGTQCCLLQPWERGTQGSFPPPGGPPPLSPGLCVVHPASPPTSSHPTSSQGMGSQAVSAGPAAWMCTHCLAPRGLGTLRPLGVLATGPSPEAGPSPGGRPGRVGAAVLVASAPPCPGGGPEAWGRPGRGKVMDTADAPCPQGCQTPPPVPWACLARGRSC